MGHTHDTGELGLCSERKLPLGKATTCNRFSPFTVVRNGGSWLHIVRICTEVTRGPGLPVTLRTGSSYCSTGAVHGAWARLRVPVGGRVCARVKV